MKNEHIGFLPICDAEGHPLGVVTDRDIVLRGCAGGLSLKTPLGEVMSSNPIRCHENTSLEDAEDQMLKHKTRRILVVDDQDHLVGLITLADIAQHETPFKAARWFRALSAERFRMEK